MKPIYCFEYNLKSRIDNHIITGFAINDYKFEDDLYGVNKAFISKNIMYTYHLGGGLIKLEISKINTKSKISFDRALVYYNYFSEAVEFSKKYNMGIEYNSYVQHCKDYKNYYEKLFELMQLIIAKWDDWN